MKNLSSHLVDESRIARIVLDFLAQGSISAFLSFFAFRMALRSASNWPSFHSPVILVIVLLLELKAGAAAEPMPSLVVTPTTSIAVSGPQGGPFTPASFQYHVSASSGEVGFSITTPAWLAAEPQIGIVDSTASDPWHRATRITYPRTGETHDQI